MDYINRMNIPPPTPSRSSSSSSFTLSSVNLSSVKLPTIKSSFFQQSKFLDTLQDAQLFNWSYSRAASVEGSEEASGFLGIGHFFTRSGATTPTLLSRSSSFSAAVTDDIAVEQMTSFKIEDVYNIKKDE